MISEKAKAIYFRSRGLNMLNCNSRSCDHGSAAAAAQFQRLHRAASVSRIELALEQQQARYRAVIPGRIRHLASGEYPSLIKHRDLGISRSCNRDHRRGFCGYRRRRDDHAECHRRTPRSASRPWTTDRPRRLALLGSNDPGRHQRRRLCQDRCRSRGHDGCAGGLHGSRRASTPDELSGAADAGWRVTSQ
jgi:hypothetical protein